MTVEPAATQTGVIVNDGHKVSVNNPIRIVAGNENPSVHLIIKEIDFTKMPDGMGIVSDGDKNRVIIGTSVDISGKINVNLFDFQQIPAEIGVVMDISLDRLDIESAEIRIDANETVEDQTIEVGELPEFLTSNTVLLDVYNPVVRLDVQNGSPFAASIDADINAFIGEESTLDSPIHIGEKGNPGTEPIIINPDTEASIFVSRRGEHDNPQPGDIDIAVPAIADLIKKVPEKLTISNIGNAELKYTVSGLSVSYITVSSTEGTVVAGGNQVLQVKLNRESMPETVNTTFIISDGTKQESVTVKATKAVAKMSVSPLSLDFGEEATEQTFTISNVGTAELAWNITVPEGMGLKVSNVSGVTAPSGSKQITVTLDRSVMPETLNTAIEVSDGTHKESIAVKAVKGSDIAGTVITQGLYTYYKFDGNFEDATENGIDGFGTGSPSFVEGVTPEGKAVKFSKMDNSTFVVSKPIVDSREMTFCFWGKDFEDGHIFHLNSSIQNDPMFSFSMDNGSLKFLVTRYANNYQYKSSPSFVHPTLTDGKWHHIAVISDFNVTTYATITTTLYVDGMEVYTLTEDANPFSENGGSQSSYSTGTSFTMGGSLKMYNGATLPATNMSVDNFRVYDTRRLSASEIKEIYNAKQ